MYSSIEQMRKAIKNVPRYAYSGSWAAKVDKMPDRQIIAIYMRFKREGLL